MNAEMRKCYETVKESYSRLKDYQIRHDTFGGYGLTYTGEVVIQPRTILRNGPLGYLAPVPDSVPSLSTVHLTSNQKVPHLMLGSVRFLNSDCEPNCRYNFDRMYKVVQIETINKIGKGDELLVKYGDEFFDVNECFCSTCNSRRRVADFPLPSSAVDSLSVGNPKKVAKKCNNHLLSSSPRRKSKVARIGEYEQRMLNPMTLDALIPLEPIQILLRRQQR